MRAFKVRNFTLAAAMAGALAGGGMATVAPAEASEPVAATAAAPGFRLVIDLSERELYVMHGDEVEETYSVAIGQPRHPTPRGSFAVRRMVWNPRWVPPDAAWARNKQPREPGDPRNPMGKVKIFFQNPDYYIHGTRDTDSLGEAESHGCIRMRNDDVIELGRMVMAHGGATRPPNWWHRVLNRVRSTTEVGLSDPVPVQIRA
ncbi:L,D-transpeptidase [Longimicrobium terrae]|uniref:Lipoprotein-anchoring transpeptidase ErfK/SrfK n=1 Tax=Longimicrobium terrae TaxID=1639882 RepID=A0A841H5T4_9BACT|nr:L,D-transpeptidase [Longimicrobium terrae]MBB4638870.1 lipoprotein-anchoring transpeptidase ErfK/SrfK [Longimicrobium terrae]MBB6073109.1 lipoprotein-anchoring transpeptidase ErfK/SrfK [Longimicrobium terrae]NNC30203.1 L,D-transpeptidase [Longimicrobium terrae]